MSKDSSWEHFHVGDIVFTAESKKASVKKFERLRFLLADFVMKVNDTLYSPAYATMCMHRPVVSLILSPNQWLTNIHFSEIM